MTPFFFWLFSAGMIICALAVILNRNAVASALCFTFAIVFMSGLFVMLSAFFLAAVQIIVTAGAVMVLFLFIIMLLDLTAMEHMPRQKIWMGFTFVLAISFLVLVAKVLAATPPDVVERNALHPGYRVLDTPNPVVIHTTAAQSITQTQWDELDDTHEIGRLLFRTDTSNNKTSYVAPFEITSLLILVATIGVIVLCKQDERPRPRRKEAIAREAPPVAERERVEVKR